MSKGTTLRNIRISDDLWNRALITAMADNTTVSDIIRGLLLKHVCDSEDKASKDLDLLSKYLPAEVGGPGAWDR